MSITLPTSGSLSFKDIDVLYDRGMPYIYKLTAYPETYSIYHTNHDGAIYITFLSNPVNSTFIITNIDGNVSFFSLSAVVGQTILLQGGLTSPYTKTVTVTDVARSKINVNTITGTYNGATNYTYGFSGALIPSTLPLQNIKLSEYGGQDCDIPPAPAAIKFSEFQGAINYPIDLGLHFTNNNPSSTSETQVICNINNRPTLIPYNPIYVSALSGFFLSTKHAHVNTNNYVMCDTPITITLRGAVAQNRWDTLFGFSVSIFMGLSGQTQTIYQGGSAFTYPLVTVVADTTRLTRTFLLQDFNIPEESVIVFYVGPGPGNFFFSPGPGWHNSAGWSSLGVDITVPNTPKLQFPF